MGFDQALGTLAEKEQKTLAMGGPEKIERQHKKGRYTARERIDRLLDGGSFEEIGSVVEDTRSSFDGKDRPSPSDGVIMGFGEVDGRSVMLYSMDFTVRCCKSISQ